MRTASSSRSRKVSRTSGGPARRVGNRPADGADTAPTSAPYADRLDRLRKLIAARELSHLLVTDPRDVGYLTGFLGGDSYLLVPSDAGIKPVLISDFRYQQELAAFEPIARIVIRKTTMLPCVAETFAAENVARCGVQGDHMTLGERDALLEHLANGPSKGWADRLVSTRGLLLAMRSIKDEHEVGLIRRAVRIQQQALMAVLPTIRPNQTELQIAARLESEMKSLGSVEPAFVSIVAARANSSLPHYRPGFVKTAKGQPLLIDWGAIWEGYRSDMTRTFHLGKWSPRLREIYQVVLDAHILSADSLRPGKTTAEIDKIARDHITRHGYGDYFGHGLGHGIGINIHEEPRLTQQVAPSPLQSGNVLTIEPGIYLPGIGGVRLENDYLVTETGTECLCTLPMNLEWATLG